MFVTDKTILTTDDIEDFIQEYQFKYIPQMTKMWQYYLGKNSKILSRPEIDPDNKTPFAYGRKIVNTFTGYGYRPGYIDYRPSDRADNKYIDTLNNIFRMNHEIIKTERAGRNTAIFGVAYEIHYIDSAIDPIGLNKVAVPRFYSADPRQVILIYDKSPEPKKYFGIHYTAETSSKFRVEVFGKGIVTTYSRINNGSGKWVYEELGSEAHFYGDVPITPYYMGDEKQGLIEPVCRLIDDYDILISDSMIEFSRFANAYLRMVGMSLGDPTGQNPKMLKQAINKIRFTRIFDRLKDKEDVSFLTKDIPKEFIDYMTTLLSDQIHTQSHVPDFSSSKFSGALSGAAIKRMLFDFENVVSSAEADFDMGLYDRITLITNILENTSQPIGDPESVVIRHRRNIPLDEKDSADVAVVMRNVGISMETTLDNMPREMIPNVEEELKRQEEEGKNALPDLDQDQGLPEDDQDTEDTRKIPSLQDEETEE